MINFIIIESSLKYQDEYKHIIDKLMFNNNISYKINSYKKYDKDLEKLISNNQRDKIYLIAVELDDKVSGINIAEEIRKYDLNSEIIFITNHDKMFETVHRNIYKVFSFIEKFHNMEERLTEDLKIVVNQIIENQLFIYSTKKELIQIDYKDILYFCSETQDRKTAIITKENKYLINLTLKEILSMTDNRFKQVHRACVVNTSEVVLYCWNKGYFKLKNGTCVRLCSKNYKSNIESEK